MGWYLGGSPLFFPLTHNLLHHLLHPLLAFSALVWCHEYRGVAMRKVVRGIGSAAPVVRVRPWDPCGSRSLCP